MPNCRLETSRRLASLVPVESLLQDLHAILVEEAGAKSFDCKSRVVVAETVVVGDGHAADGMVHLEIGLLPGRTPEVKSVVGRRALELLRRYFERATAGVTMQFTVQIREMERETYFKAVSTPVPA